MESENSQSQSIGETQTLTTPPHQQTQTITSSSSQSIDISQLTIWNKEQIEGFLILVGQLSTKVRKSTKEFLDLISQRESQIMRACLLCQSVDYSDQNEKLTQLYLLNQNYKLRVVQQLQQAITIVNQQNHIVNQQIRKYKKTTHKTDLNQYLNCIRNSIDQNLLKGMPTPILLMIGPALNNK